MADFRRLMAAAVAGLALSANVNAGIIEPDDYAVGDSIVSSDPGVTLSIVGRSASVVALDGFSPFNARNLATTGTQVFGQSPVAPPIASGQVWDQVNYGLLRVDFVSPVSFVAIDVIFDDDDTGFLRAFNSSGNEIEYSQGSGDGRLAAAFFTGLVSRPVADIAAIEVGGLGEEAVFLDNLRFEVPAPASALLLGTSLILLRRHLRRAAM